MSNSQIRTLKLSNRKGKVDRKKAQEVFKKLYEQRTGKTVEVRKERDGVVAYAVKRSPRTKLSRTK